MKNEGALLNKNELEFVVFCIENLALRKNLNARDVYAALTAKNDFLNSYIIPGYTFLHTQDKEYILNDIEEALELRGIKI